MPRPAGEREYIDFLALFGNNLIEAGAFREAASVYKLLASRDRQQKRWLLGRCHCLLCAADAGRAAEALEQVVAGQAADRASIERLSRRLKLLNKRAGRNQKL